LGNKKIKKLTKTYNTLCSKKSDINEHLSTLVRYGKMVDHITEFGVRIGRSTIAFLFSQPKKMISYDINQFKQYQTIKPLIENTDFKFIQSDVLKIDIEETDLLFIDTYHSYNQLKKELALHGNKVKKYIIFHDTETFGYKGMDGKSPGLLQAIHEYIENSKWFIDEIYKNNNGLLILKNDF
jgi:hypothetical protein